MKRPFEDFYIYSESFSIPTLDLTGLETMFIAYCIFMAIPLITGMVLNRIELLPILFSMTLLRVFVSLAPIIGVFAALYLWWRDMKLCLFTEKAD
jgi:uncharacterized membrane protein